MKNYVQIVLYLLISLGMPAFAQNLNDTITLKEVNIDGINAIKITQSNILKAQLEESNARDLGDYFRSIPNISGVRRGGVALDPVVRGFKYSQLNVMLDDVVKIEGGCPNRMDPVASHIEIEEVDKIEIIKGPYALTYGPSFGGLINMKTNNLKYYKKFELHSQLNTGYENNWDGHRESLSLYGGNKLFSFRLSGGNKNYANYTDGNGNRIKSAFTKYFYTAAIGAQINPNHNVGFKLIESHGRDVYYPALPMDEVSDDTRILSSNYNYIPTNKKLEVLSLKLYHSNVLHVMDNSKRSNYTQMQAIAEAHAKNFGGKIEASYNFKKLKIHTGIDYEDVFKDGNRNMKMKMTMAGLTTISEKNTNLWQNGKIKNIGTFAEASFIKPFATFHASLRLDYNYSTSDDTLVISKDYIDYFRKSKTEFFNPTATIAIDKKVSKSLMIRWAIGRGVRSPNLTERYIKFLAVGFDNYDYLGNPNLKPETNYQTDITVEWNNAKTGKLMANCFYSYVTDVITAKIVPPNVARPKTSGVIGVKQFINADEAYYYGFEMAYNSEEISKLGVELIGSYTYAVIPNTTKYLLTNNQVTSEVELSNDALPEIPPMEGTISVFYRFLNNKFVPKYSLRLVAPQNHSSEAFYEPSTPGFQISDVSFTFKPNKILKTTIGCKNIFDLPYYEHLNRKIIGSNAKLLEPGRIFFINLTINI